MIVAEIFWVFFKISFLSFGGVFGALPELERMIVIEKGWITSDRFIQSYVMSQFLPGPNMVMCPLIGFWVAGLPGWFAGFLGIYSAPLLGMGVTWAVLKKHFESEWFRRLERGLRPVVLGLLVGSGARLWWIQTRGGGAPIEIASLILLGLGFWAHQRRWLGAFTIVFVMGFIWWLVRNVLG